MSETATLIRGPQEIGSGWLEEVLARPTLELLGREQIGTGQMSQTHRVRFAETGGAEESVVVKLASEDPASRATGVGMGAYRREVDFYRELADQIGEAAAPLPPGRLRRGRGLVHARARGRRATASGDQIAGCDVARAEIALRALARVHAPVLGRDRARRGGVPESPQPARPGAAGAAAARASSSATASASPRSTPRCAGASSRASTPGRRTGAHRSASCTATTGSTTCCSRTGAATVVDWQTVSWGPAMRRRLLLPRRLPAGRGAPRARGAAAARIPRRAARARRADAELGALLGGVPPACFHGLRDDDRRVDDRRAHRARRRDVHDVARAQRPAGARPRRRRAAARGQQRPAAAAAARPRRRGPPRAGPRGAVERELVLRRRLRRRLARRVRAARAAAEPGRGPLHRLRLRPRPSLGDARRRGRAAARGGRRPAVDRDRALRAEQQLRGAAASASGCSSRHRPRRTTTSRRRCAASPASRSTSSSSSSGRPTGIPYAWRAVDPLRDPLPGERHRAAAATSRSSSPGRASATTRGARATGGRVDWMWSALHLEDGTHTHAVGAAADARATASATSSATRSCSEIETGPRRARARPRRPDHRRRASPRPHAARAGGRAARLRRRCAWRRPTAGCRSSRARCAAVRTADGRTGTGWVEWNRVQR